LAVFQAGPLSWSNWNLELLIFVEGEKDENQQQTKRMVLRAILGGRRALSPHRQPCCTVFVRGASITGSLFVSKTEITRIVL